MAQIGQLDTNLVNFHEIDEYCKVNCSDPIESRVLRPSHFLGETITQILGLGQHYLPLPWQNRDCPVNFEFRPNELTVWAGTNGVGKSMLTSQLALMLSAQGESCCLASFEMTAHRAIARLVQQTVGKTEDVDKIKDAVSTMSRRLWIYDKVGRATSEEIQKLAHYVSSVHGVKHLFIDSLMMCVKGEDDYNGQKDFMEDLIQLVKELPIHVHLICHMRKDSDDIRGVGAKNCIKGSGAISDLAFNVIVLQRNIEKLDERGQINRVHDDEPDMLMNVTKQRNGDTGGNYIPLWWNGNFLSFCDNRSLICPIPNLLERPF